MIDQVDRALETGEIEIEEIPSLPSLIHLDPGQRRRLAVAYIVSQAQRVYEPELVKAVTEQNVKHRSYGNSIIRLGLTIKTICGISLVVSVSRNQLGDEAQRLRDKLEKAKALLRLRPSHRREAYMAELQAEYDRLCPLVTRDLLYIPAALEEANSLSRVLLRFCHEQGGHASENATLHEMRKEFWIPKARRLLKSIRRQCQVCDQLMTQFLKQKEAPLPMERLRSERAFQAVGVDFVGPFAAVGHDPIKPYILVIACATYRVVCLQPTIGSGTDAVTLGFEAFQNTRGVKTEIIFSDNAESFIAADRLELRHQNIHWKKNAPRAPWWGGFYERVMRIIKTFIARVFGRFVFQNWQQFSAAVAYLERLINSRPITAFSDQRGETMITPNMFINPQQEDTFSSRVLDEFSSKVLDDYIPRAEVDRSANAAKLVRAYRSLKGFYGRLYTQFQTSYLDGLREFHPTKFFGHDPRSLQVGDIVLLKPDSPFKMGSAMKRVLWRKGKITEVFKTRADGRIRTVSVQVDTEDGKSKILARVPIQNIAPLEVMASPTINEDDEEMDQL
jgi:hypothetical protein